MNFMLNSVILVDDKRKGDVVNTNNTHNSVKWRCIKKLNELMTTYS